MLDHEVPTVAKEIAAGDGFAISVLARTHDTSPSTCFRWITRGLPDAQGRRVYLEALRRGKRWYTSRGAVERFFARLPQSCGAIPQPATPRTPNKRARESARAQK